MQEDVKKPGRSKLEAGVAKVGRSLSDLIKIAETEIDLELGDIERSFAYIASVIEAARQRAALGHQVGKAAAGGFSLDEPNPLFADIPFIPAPTPTYLVPQHFPPKPAPQRPERIVGQQRRPERLVGERKNAPLAHDDDGVDFIED